MLDSEWQFNKIWIQAESQLPWKKFNAFSMCAIQAVYEQSEDEHTNACSLVCTSSVITGLIQIDSICSVSDLSYPSSYSYPGLALAFGCLWLLESRWQEPHLAKKVSTPHRNIGKLMMWLVHWRRKSCAQACLKCIRWALSAPFFWMRYLRDALREFIKMFWCQPRQCQLLNIFCHNLRIYMLIMSELDLIYVVCIDFLCC